MRIENERVSQSQLMYAFICFMQATMMRSAFVSSVTGIDSWAMVFTGALVHLPMLLGYVTLLRWFPGDCLFVINNKVFGPVIGRLFSAVYMYFLLTLIALNGLDVGYFVVDFMMPGMPMMLVLAVMMIACAHAVRKGTASYMRLAPLFAIGTFVVVALNFILVIKDTKMEYLFPMFQQPLIKYIQGTHITATIPYGESVVFMMIAPALEDGKCPKKPLVLGLIISSLFMFGIVFRDTISLGPLMTYIALPSFEAVRMINLGNVVTRIESLYGILNVSLLYFKLCLLIYACARGFAKLVGAPKYKHLALVVGAFSCAYGMTAYSSGAEHAYSGSYVAPFLWLIFEYAMPTITLMAALVYTRRRRKAGVAG
jgi:spore germination protein KB